MRLPTILSVLPSYGSNDMNTLLKTVMLLLVGALYSNALAGEPPATVALKDRVRMATLIVVGKIDKVSIMNTRSGKFVDDHYPLKADEALYLHLKVDRVLYPPAGEPPFFFPKDTTLTEVPIRINSYQFSATDFRKDVSNESQIFYLTTHVDRATPYFYYPFFNWTNLSDPLSKEGEVTRLITAFGAVE